jgi:hypothetical protein
MISGRRNGDEMFYASDVLRKKVKKKARGVYLGFS